MDSEKEFVNKTVCLQMAHGKHINDEDETKHAEKESIGYQQKSNTARSENKNWWYTTKI